MKPEGWQQIETLYHAALERAEPDGGAEEIEESHETFQQCRAVSARRSLYVAGRVAAARSAAAD
jgi:hypothetical protein